VLVNAVDLLVRSGRVYVYGDTIVLQGPGPGGDRLVPLRTGSVAEVGAEALLANLFVCQQEYGQFPVPKWFADVLLRAEPLRARLPRIRHYATRPIFDDDVVRRDPGWHPAVGILVHGPAVEPVMTAPGNTSEPARGRLAAHLRTLLQGFCFRSDADLVNAVGLLLTGLLMNHFVVCLKPVGLLDGNQPGLGKTLLARVFGVVFDDIDPWLIPYKQDDQELQKRICSTLRNSRQSSALVDNAKVRGGSVVTMPWVTRGEKQYSYQSVRVGGRARGRGPRRGTQSSCRCFGPSARPGPAVRPFGEGHAHRGGIPSTQPWRLAAET
jgi:hypothetical protein